MARQLTFQEHFPCRAVKNFTAPSPAIRKCSRVCYFTLNILFLTNQELSAKKPVRISPASRSLTFVPARIRLFFGPYYYCKERGWGGLNHFQTFHRKMGHGTSGEWVGWLLTLSLSLSLSHPWNLINCVALS